MYRYTSMYTGIFSFLFNFHPLAHWLIVNLATGNLIMSDIYPLVHKGFLITIYNIENMVLKKIDMK